jgi:CheY-like chemotaxis protein/ABC-type Na+ transport system ATPase subunit NatA
MRAQALKVGANILDRVMITDLLTSDGKHPTAAEVVGAVGFDVRSGDFYIFKANYHREHNGKGVSLEERILIVDDEKDTVEMITTLLELEGYQVLSAQSGVEAMRFLKREKQGALEPETPVDLILLDVMLGDEDGREICRRILEESSLIQSIPQAHAQEHSLEVQLPFLQMVSKTFKLVPIVMEPYWSWETCQSLAAAIAETVKGKNVLLIASSDLSHFHSYQKAVELDKIVLNHIERFDPEGLNRDLKQERCEACGGEGYIQIEMQFLPDVTVPCEVCEGKRYNREALEIKFRGKNIAEVLDMTVEQSLSFFEHFPRIKTKLDTLKDVGLGYIRLGQPAPTLSGGEAQRIKLSRELGKRTNRNTLYILDEPTIGLHAADIQKLLDVLMRLVDMGNTIVVIEHNLEVIKVADHVIDLGPEGGERGGFIVAEGTPEDIARSKDSYHRPVP